VDLNGAGLSAEGLSTLLQFLCSRIPPTSKLAMNVWVDNCGSQHDRINFYTQLLRQGLSSDGKELSLTEFPAREDHLASLVRLLPDLRVLTIRESNVSPLLEVLPGLLKTNTSLETLVLNDNNLTDKQVATLAMALGHNRTLRNLEFENNPTTQLGATLSLGFCSFYFATHTRVYPCVVCFAQQQRWMPWQRCCDCHTSVA